MQARARTSRALSIAGAASLALVVACASPEPEESATATEDLLPLLPFTDTAQATETIEFASPLGEAHLVSGWSAEPPEDAQPHPGARYLRQPAGRMFLHLAAPAERTVTIRCAGVNASKRSLPATFHLNGVYVGQGAFPATMESVVVRLPPRAQRVGRNELAIVARIPRRPPPEIARRHGLRAVALACERLTLGGPAPRENLPRLIADDGGPQLLLPPDTTAQVYLRAQPESVIELAARRSDPGASLRVRRENRSGDADVLYEGAPGTAALRLPLGGRPGEIVRLHVDAGGGGAVRLDRLVLETPRGPPLGAPGPRHSRPHNVILYVIDTLRADHLGCYGYARDTSPRLDALAREAVLFEDAQAQASWTRPAVASLLTGVTPLRHGAVRLRSALGDHVPTLAEILRAKGWATAAWVTNMNVSPHWGFARGFDRYEYLEEDTREGRVYVPAATIQEAAIGWIRERRDQPFFLYLHASDTHGPYTPGDPWRERFEVGTPPVVTSSAALAVQAVMQKGRQASAADVEWLKSLYDGEIAELDASIGAFVEQLRALGTLDRTLLVVVADHGEEFHDHGALSHGRTLHRELLQVPLLVRFPGGAHGGTRVGALVQHVDVFSTILEQLGVPVPDGVDGRSLLARVTADGAPDPDALAVSHTWLGQAELVSTTAPDWKVIVRRQGARRARPGVAKSVEIYDRANDRDERANVAADQALLGAWAQQELGARTRQVAAAVERPVSPETEQKLRALGYVAD